MALLGNKLQQAYSATAKDTFNGDGSTVAFTLSRPSRTNDVEVFVENVQQEPTVAYAVSGTTLTFTEAPVSGTGNIYVIHRTQATQSLTVNTNNITDGAITAAKIASGVIPDAVTKSATAPSSPVDGDLWYDTSNKTLNVYNSTASDWGIVTPIVPANISGGTEVTEGNYKYHIFKTSGTLTVTAGVDSANVLVVAGGGSGGGVSFHGGGGAGGYIDTTASLTAGSYTITVGAGGSTPATNYQGTNGENSVAFGNTAIGGGAGAAYQERTAASGGSGGGDAGHTGGAAGAGASGQGNDGGNGSTYAGGGGGGAGAVGSNGAGNGAGGAGGIGVSIGWITSTVATNNAVGEVSGSSVYFCGGGGGSNGQNASGDVLGGLGGGGKSTGDGDLAVLGTAGTTNTGGGGGGGNAGGSGIVIIRYAV